MLLDELGEYRDAIRGGILVGDTALSKWEPPTEMWREHGLLARQLDRDDSSLRAEYAAVAGLRKLLEDWPDPVQRRTWTASALAQVGKGLEVCERHADL
jgi:hypothetical protein